MAVAGFLCLALSLQAQNGSLVTSISTTTIAGTPGAVSSEGSIVFNNSTIRLDSFNTATASYAVTGLANQVFVRRSSSAPAQSSVWYATNTSGGNPIGVHIGDYGSLLLSNNLAMGSDNTFANSPSGSQVGNIERIDFIFSSPIAASSNLAFAVFERGAAGQHDQFKIAAITGWSGNTVSSYGSLVGPTASWGGASNVQTDFNYRLFRYASANPDDLSTSSANSETGNQGLGGMVYNMAQLGISNGTLVYGYSLFGYDVGTNGSDPLVLSTYSSTTDSSTGGGGVDLAGVNGLAFVLVPEPSTYALGGVGVMAALAVLHRHRQRKLRNPDGKGTAA